MQDDVNFVPNKASGQMLKEAHININKFIEQMKYVLKTDQSMLNALNSFNRYFREYLALLLDQDPSILGELAKLEPQIDFLLFMEEVSGIKQLTVDSSICYDLEKSVSKGAKDINEITNDIFMKTRQSIEEQIDAINQIVIQSITTRIQLTNEKLTSSSPVITQTLNVLDALNKTIGSDESLSKKARTIHDLLQSIQIPLPQNWVDRLDEHLSRIAFLSQITGHEQYFRVPGSILDANIREWSHCFHKMVLTVREAELKKEVEDARFEILRKENEELRRQMERDMAERRQNQSWISLPTGLTLLGGAIIFYSIVK